MWSEFVSSGSIIVKRLRRRKYDQVIIDRTKGLLLGPSTALYRSFQKHCTLTNKAVGTIWRDLSKAPQRRQGPDPRTLWLIVGTPLVLGPDLDSRRAEHGLLWRMSLYIFDILFLLYNYLTCLCNNFYGLSFGQILVLGLYWQSHTMTRTYRRLCSGKNTVKNLAGG